MKHSFDEKLRLMRILKSGSSITSLSKETGYDWHTLKGWLLRYEKYGESGLHRAGRGYHFSQEEKTAIVFAHLEKGVSLHTLSITYDVSRTSIRLWLRQARSAGSFNGRGLQQKPEESMRIKKEEENAELLRLRAENLRLRAENALLKKARALVEEKRNRSRLTGSGSSTH